MPGGSFCRLTQGGQVLTYFHTEDETFSFFTPAPLAPGQVYVLELQFRESDQPPWELNWNNYDEIYTAAITADRLRIVSGHFERKGDGGELTLTWDAVGAANALGAAVYVEDLNTSNLLKAEGKSQFTERTARLSFQNVETHHTHAVSLAANIPSGPGQKGALSDSVTSGTPSVLQPIPTEAPEIASVSFDGSQVLANWKQPPLPEGHELHLM